MRTIPSELVKKGKLHYISSNSSKVFHPETEVSQVIGLQEALAQKEDTLTFDVTPTENSLNPVTSGGVYLAFQSIDALPSQTNNSGKFLTTDGSTASWANVDVLPSQANNSGKFLTTDGTTASWVSLSSVQEVFSVNSSTASVTLVSAPNNIDANYIAVYHDGLRLVNNIDYTYNSSTKTVSFNKTFLNGDQIVVYIGPIEPGTSGSGDSGESGGSIEGLPSQTGNSGKFLTTNGSNVSWGNVFSGNYNDLTNKPTIPTVPTNISSFTNDAGYITGVSWNDVSNKPTLATVATTGDYEDLINTPTIPTVPTNVSSFTNDVGYITSVSWSDVTNKPNFFSGSYNDLSDKPTIPTVPTTVSSFTNDAGYITTVAWADVTNKPDLTLKANVSDLATVATTGDYEDLTNLPDIPDVPDQTNKAGKYLTTNGTVMSWDRVIIHPSEKCVLNNNASGTIALDIDDAVIYSLNMTGNSTITITKDSTLDIYATNRSATITLLIKNGGSYTIVWPNNLTWADNIAPTLGTSNKYDIITLITFDSGTTWLGLTSGANYTIS